MARAVSLFCLTNIATRDFETAHAAHIIFLLDSAGLKYLEGKGGAESKFWVCLPRSHVSRVLLFLEE